VHRLIIGLTAAVLVGFFLVRAQQIISSILRALSIILADALRLLLDLVEASDLLCKHKEHDWHLDILAAVWLLQLAHDCHQEIFQVLGLRNASF
jgi:hypothetical protein